MPKSKEMISDTSSESGSGSSHEEAKIKSKPKKQEKKKVESSASEDSESEEDTKSKKRTKKGKDDKAPAKKAKTEDKSKNKDKTEWDLGGNKFVNVRHFKGNLYVDIREMYLDKDGERKPGRKGISMNLKVWRELVNVIGEVDECVKSIN